MSMKKQKGVDVSHRDYIKGELADNKVWIISILLLIALWVFNFIYNLISVFELILTIMTLTYVIILFWLSIRNGAQYVAIMDSVQTNPDIQKFFELVADKTEEEIEEIITKAIEDES